MLYHKPSASKLASVDGAIAVFDRDENHLGNDTQYIVYFEINKICLIPSSLFLLLTSKIVKI